MEERINELCKEAHEIINHIGLVATEDFEDTFLLFLKSILDKDYDRTFQYVDIIDKTSNKYYQNECNFCLWLLNFIIEIPEKYQKKVKSLKFYDIKILADDKRYKHISRKNKFRHAAINQRFKTALRIIQNCNVQRKKALPELIIEILLNKAYDVQQARKKQIKMLVEEKQYDKLIIFLEQLKERYSLARIDECILFLAKEISRIIKTGIISKKEEMDTNNNFVAIYNHDYDLALELEKNVDDDFNVLNVLLETINDLKKSRNIIEEVEEKEEFENSYVTIISSLVKGNYELAIEELRNYLISIGALQYEFLIIDLIKISIENNDFDFIRPMNVLFAISRGTFSLNIYEYAKSFYKAMGENKLEIARLYLHIITKINDLGSFSIKANPEENEYKEITKLVSGKVQQVYENGVVLLEPMKSYERHYVHRFVELIKGVKSFSIGTEPNRRIILIHRPHFKEKIDLLATLRAGKDAYKAKDYDLCIKHLNILLRVGKPRSNIYALLGLSYWKKENLNLAIDFLTIATELAKEEGSQYDYTELIKDLSGDKLLKEPTEMVESDFEDEFSDYYGMENMAELRMLLSSGVGIKDACTKLNLSEEQIAILNLILARDCFAQEVYSLGDNYLKRVQRMKNKTAQTKEIYDTILKNRKFYKNRVPENHTFLLTLTRK